MRFYGAGAAQNDDNSGEIISLDGMDVSRCRILCDEHGSDAWSIIGSVDYCRKIYSREECQDDRERRVWDAVKVPFLFVAGTIAVDSGHPNAQAAASLLKFTSNRPDIPLKVGLSIEGGIMERSGPDNKTLSKTVATGVAFTVKPCNPRCVMFMEGDLQKSDLTMAPPPAYFEALKKSDATRSFFENPNAVLLVYAQVLKKSLEDYLSSFTSMKCYKCGEGVRFFKSSSDIPNRCSHCNNPFTLSHIWKAMNK